MRFDVLLLMGPQPVGPREFLQTRKQPLDARPFGPVQPLFDDPVDVRVLGIADFNPAHVQGRLGQSFEHVIDGVDLLGVIREDVFDLVPDRLEWLREPWIGRIQERTAEPFLEGLTILRAVEASIGEHRFQFVGVVSLFEFLDEWNRDPRVVPTASLHPIEDRLLNGDID